MLRIPENTVSCLKFSTQRRIRFVAVERTGYHGDIIYSNFTFRVIDARINGDRILTPGLSEAGDIVMAVLPG